MIGTSINDSAVLSCVAGADITNGAGKAVKYNENGAVVLCNTAGESMLGIIILQTDAAVKEGESLTVQTCCKGKALAGGDIKAGDLLAVDTNGAFVKAEAGNHVVGQAIIDKAASTGAAWKAGSIFGIEILKGGQLNA